MASPPLPSPPLSPAVDEWVQCLFVDLKRSTPNPARVSYDTLCQLDMEAVLLLLLDHCLEEVGRMVKRGGAEGEDQQLAILLSTLFLVRVPMKEDLVRFWSSALLLHARMAR